MVNIKNEYLVIFRINTEGPSKESISTAHSFITLFNKKDVRATVYAEVAPEKFLIYSVTHNTFALLNCASPSNEIIAVRLAGLSANSVRAVLFPTHKAAHFFYMSDKRVETLPLKLHFNQRQSQQLDKGWNEMVYGQDMTVHSVQADLLVRDQWKK